MPPTKGRPGGSPAPIWDEDDRSRLPGPADAPGPTPRRAEALAPEADTPGDLVDLEPTGRWADALNDQSGGVRLEEGWDDFDRILQELDRLHSEVLEGTTRDVPVPRPAPPAELAPRPREQAPEPPVASRSEARPAPKSWPGPTPYLEERLRVANAAVSSLGREVRDLDERWRWLMQTTASLEGEIQRANRELEFMRSVGWMESGARSRPSTAPSRVPPVPPPRPPARPIQGSRPAALAPAVHAHERFEPYRKFTSARYNQTVGELKARRRRLGSWTLVVAGAISAVLLTLTAVANEPMPTWWLAVLPAIWMIPVPFFLLSFRGTHRVLRRNHLEVALEP